MNDIPVTIIGNVVGELRFLVTETGVPLASFRVVARPRRYERATGEWVDGDPNFFLVNCWRTLGENVASSLGRGDPVVVTGRLRVRSSDGDMGRGHHVEVDAASVGHDMRWGTSAFRRARRRDRTPSDRAVSSPRAASDSAKNESATEHVA